jgi:WD40 repeat protein
MTGYLATMRAFALRAAPFAVALVVWLLTESSVPAADTPLARISTQGRVFEIAFSPDGKYIAASTGPERAPTATEVYSLETKKLVKRLYILPPVAFSPDGKLLAGIAKCGGATLVFDTENWQARPVVVDSSEMSESDVKHIALSPDGKQVAVATEDSEVGLWNLADGTLSRKWKANEQDKKGGPITLLTFTADGHPFAALGERDVLLRNLRTETTTVGPLNIGPYTVHKAALSPDGKTFATANVDEPKLFDSRTGALLFDLKGVTGHTYGMAFTPNGRHLITGGMDCHARPRDETDGIQVKAWDVSTGKQIAALSGKLPDVLALAVAPDGATLATGAREGITIWDLKALLSAKK